MTEPTTLGPYLRTERERRGLTLRTISENTKVSIGLLEGLEADDISRWPGGIFRRAFVRSYAQCIGLDADDVIRRFERQFPTEENASPDPVAATANVARHPTAAYQAPQRSAPAPRDLPARSRLLGTAADLTVAAILAFGCAAAGSRLLWPVLLIAFYYAAGVLITGTSPMVALLAGDGVPRPRAAEPTAVETAEPAVPIVQQARPVERRQPSRRGDRHVRHRRGAQARA